MADDSSKDQKSLAATTGGKKDRGDVKAQRRGILSRVWNGIFRIQRDDFEKRLQYISKEEASVMARMKRRSQSWRRLARHLIIFSVVLEVIIGFISGIKTSLLIGFEVVELFLNITVCNIAHLLYVDI